VFFVQYGFKKTRYVSMGNSLPFVRYGNGGDLSFMLIIVYTEFVMISLFRSNIPTSKAGEKYKVLLKVSLH
jgi:hypothetical protein